MIMYLSGDTVHGVIAKKTRDFCNLFFSLAFLVGCSRKRQAAK